jgi:cytochrome c oxidase cbb3-type subunit I
MTEASTVAEPDIDNQRRVAIDRSVKAPVLFLFTNAAFWLMASTLMGFLAAAKLVNADFLHCEWLSFGRLQPAHLIALVYGWGIQAGLGVMLWLMARRTANELRGGQGTLITLGVLWNIIVTIAIVSVLGGASRSIEWLEFPTGLWPVMLLIFLMFAFKIVGMAAKPTRVSGFTITTMYLVAACFWFAWLFITANTLINNLQLGPLSAGISSWFVHGTILMFFVPVGVGSAYYFIPKITGQPIHSAQLSELGFWVLAVFAGWTGLQRYANGPLPAWMAYAGSAASVVLLISVGIVGLNHHLTTLGSHRLVESSPTLRFTFVGALFYPVSGLILALISNVWTGPQFQFTHAWYGYQIVAIYGFFSMCVFGAIYYIVPRLAGCEWLSVRLIRNHFWFSVYGIAVIVVTAVVSGIAHGESLNDPGNWASSFWNVVANSKGYMVARAMAWLMILWSNTWFLIHLLLMVAGLGRRSSSPTLLGHDHDEAHLPQVAKA